MLTPRNHEVPAGPPSFLGGDAAARSRNDHPSEARTVKGGSSRVVGNPADRSSSTGEGIASPPKSRKPRQKGDGQKFHLTPGAFDRAVALANFDRTATLLLPFVREVSWLQADLDQREPMPCAINQTHLATDSGINRSMINRSLNDLIDGNVFTRQDGLYSVNLDFTTWSSKFYDPALATLIRDGWRSLGYTEKGKSGRRRSPLGGIAKDRPNCAETRTVDAGDCAETRTLIGTNSDLKLCRSPHTDCAETRTVRVVAYRNGRVITL